MLSRAASTTSGSAFAFSVEHVVIDKLAGSCGLFENLRHVDGTVQICVWDCTKNARADQKCCDRFLYCHFVNLMDLMTS